MPNADTTLIDRAKEACMSLATYGETRGHLQRGVRSAPPDQHIPGDTTTPPAPGAVWIGSGDA
ncbi:hypothetical protein [Achromobacter denitrificans]|uniref:hypothetical protein n=1 Tax=Achromobacter denitrificans TaxID=32002 RepID=UPI003B99C263